VGLEVYLYTIFADILEDPYRTVTEHCVASATPNSSLRYFLRALPLIDHYGPSVNVQQVSITRTTYRKWERCQCAHREQFSPSSKVRLSPSPLHTPFFVLAVFHSRNLCSRMPRKPPLPRFCAGTARLLDLKVFSSCAR
jgi:hypothetical protein